MKKKAFQLSLVAAAVMALATQASAAPVSKTHQPLSQSAVLAAPAPATLTAPPLPSPQSAKLVAPPPVVIIDGERLDGIKLVAPPPPAPEPESLLSQLRKLLT